MKSRWIVAGAAALSLGILTLPMLRGRSGGGEPIRPNPESVASRNPSCDQSGVATYDFVLKDQHNVPVKMADYKGKVVIVNFWATWCGPCKAEIPSLVELQEKYADDLVVLGFSVDDPAEKMKPYAEEYKVNYPLLVGNGREDVQNAFGPLLGIPVSVIIGRDGIIAKKHTGIGTMEQFEREIKALL
jgi:thiol-disulfide isomerase/thioredoxin